MNTNRIINEFKIKVDWLDDSLEYYLKNHEKLKIELRYGVKTNFTKPDYTHEIRRPVATMNVGIQDINERDFIVVPPLQIREHEDGIYDVFYISFAIHIFHNVDIRPEDTMDYTHLIGRCEWEVKNDDSMDMKNQDISIAYWIKGKVY